MNSIKSLWTTVFLNMPPAVRGLLMVFTVGGVAGIVLLLHTLGYTSRGFYIAVTIAVVVIAMFGGLIIGIAKWRKKRRAKAAGEVIKDSSGGAEGVSSADEIARLDQLRKDWDAAVRKFEENNHDGLYSLPWYLLVGEPGSGKTEAIRHSGIPFPTGLNKPNQGTGGTYNMDWWFANDAIIIDTAGRLLFNETREWTELLKRLGKLRPHCPINGMLLVIPTDSLLKDSSHEIETKASRIAEQINSIKRELGIRFPVFVVVSKSDYITGFREYFSHLDDPTLEHQMMGWSNPHPLDEPFNPDLVDEHLESVSQRLIRRRTAMLLDPPLVDEMSDRTADQVDALYAFPEEIKRIKNRLRLYMEQIFTPGPWSRRPPFIRGIFFTSSMQEGKELDTALAELLNVDVSELPEGRVWNKDKAYFLRDLFTQKVFPEKGLVTRAVNAAQNYRRNKLIVNGVGFAAIALSVAFGVKAFWDFKEGIDDPQQWWSGIAQASENSLPALIVPDDRGTPKYQGQQQVQTAAGTTHSLAYVLEESSKKAGRSIAPRGLLRPVAFFTAAGGIDEIARRTNARLFNHIAITPLATQAKQKFKRDDRQWPREAAPALAQLLHMARLAHHGSGNDAEHGPQIEPLLQFVLESDDAYQGDVQALQSAVDMAYSDRGYPGIRDQNVRVQDHAAIMKAAEAGIERWGAHWSAQVEGDGGLFAKLVELRAAVESFSEKEEDMLAIVADCSNVADYWQASYPALDKARQRLDEAAAAFAGGGSILESVKSRMQAFLDDTVREYELLAGQLPEGEQSDEPLAVLRQRLTGVWEQLQAAHEERGNELVQAIGMYENDHLAAAGDAGLPAYASRSNKYRLINAEMVRQPESGVDLLSLEAAVAAVDGRILDLRNSVLASRRPVGRQQSSSGLEGLVDSMLDCGCEAAEQVQKNALYEIVIVKLPESAGDVEALVHRSTGDGEYMPTIPLTALADQSSRRVRYDPRYNPQQAAKLIQGWLHIKESDRVQRAQRVAFSSYVERYVRYWTGDVPSMTEFVHPDSWTTLIDSLGDVNINAVNSALKEIGEEIIRALSFLDAMDDPSWSGPRNQANTIVAAVQADMERHDQNYNQYGKLRSGWRVDSERLRRQILNMDRATFVEQHLPVGYSEDTDGPQPNVLRYWNTLALGCLKMLADEVMDEVETARELMARRYNRFPLLLGGDVSSAMTVAEVRDALAQVQTLQVAETASSREFGGRLTIGSGDRITQHRRVNSHLERLCGIDANRPTVDDRDTQRRRKAVELIAAALGGDEPLHAQVIGWDGRSSAAAIHERFRIIIDGTPTNAQSTFQEASAPDMRFHVTRDQSIRFEFGAVDGDFTTVGMLPDGPWPVLAAVASGECDSTGEVGCKEWDIVIRVAGGTEFRVRIQLSHPLPARTHWPTPENWPYK